MKYKYRNNLVRATLSVFAVCTLLYIASSSAHSSTQLNSPAPTPEFSDAPVATSLGPLLSEDIARDESYTLEVIAQGTATHEAPTMVLAQMESAQQPQLATPMIANVILSGGSITANWSSAGRDNVERYRINLYLGSGTSGAPERTGEIIVVTTGHVFTFQSLLPSTEYTVELIAQAAGFRDSEPDTETVTAGKLQLSAPEVTAAFVARRSGPLTLSNIRIAWSFDENASSYGLNFYDANENLSSFVQGLAPAAEYVREDVLFLEFLTVGVTAIAKDPATHLNSEEVRVPVLPPKLLSEFFTVTKSTSSLSLAWDSSFDASSPNGVYFYDAVFIDRLGSSASSLLLISIEDPQGSEIIGTAEVSTDADVYSTDGLDEATNYVLKTVHRVTLGDDSRDSEALEIPFRTLTVLPEPTESQISWIAGETILTVSWDNVETGVTAYELSLAREGTPIGTPKEVNALVAGSTTFTDLNAETTYTLSVVAKGDARLYAPSPQYRVSVIIVPLPQLATPVIDEDIVGGTIVFGYEVVENAEKYIFKLYLGDDTIGEVFRSGERALNTGIIVFAFFSLAPLTQYTVEVIAQAAGHRNSDPLTRTLTTGKVTLPMPTVNELRITSSTDNITVTFQNTPMGVDGYALSIRERFDNFEIAQSTQEFTIAASTIVFSNLVPGRGYTLLALPLFDMESYEFTNTPAEIGFMTIDAAPLSTSAIEIEVTEESTTNNTIQVSWEAVERVQFYQLKLYQGDNTNTQAIQETSTTKTNAIFKNIQAITDYTVEVIGRSMSGLISEPTTRVIRLLPIVTEEDIATVVNANSIGVSLASILPEIERYEIDISPQIPDQAAQVLSVNQLRQIVFDGLELGVDYTLTVTSSTDDTRYINEPVYTKIIRTYIDVLPATTITAVSEDRRNSVRVNWGRVANAERYRVRLYEGASDITEETRFVEEVVNAPSLSHTFQGLSITMHHTAEVVPITDHFLSNKTRTIVSPDILLNRSFRLEENEEGEPGSLNLFWNSDQSDADFYSKAFFSTMLISVEDVDGTVFIEQEEVSTTANTYSINGLDADTSYTLKIALRMTQNDISIDGETLSISLAKVAPPTTEQITLAIEASGGSVVFSWDNVPDGISEYIIGIGGTESPPVFSSRRFDARIPGFVTFNTVRTITPTSIVATDTKGRRSVPYSPRLTFESLQAPTVSLTTERNGAGINKNTITASWGNVDAEHYTLILTDIIGGGSSHAVTVGGIADTHTFRNLMPTTGYSLQVIARAGGSLDGRGAAAQTVTGKGQHVSPTRETVKIIADIDKVTIRLVRLEIAQPGTYSVTVNDETRSLPAVVGEELVYNFGVRPSEYNILVMAEESERYEGASNDYTERLTPPSRRLLSPFAGVVARTENRRRNIRAEWAGIDNAQTYTVRLYKGVESSIDESTQAIAEAVVTSPGRSYTFNNMNSNTHFTVGVVATDNYSTNEETRATVTPPTLQAKSFRYQRSSTKLDLNWYSNKSQGSDFYSKTLGASLLISLEDTAGVVVQEQRVVSTTANTYELSNLLRNNNYVLKIALRVTQDGVSVNGEEISVPIPAFLQPTDEQITVDLVRDEAMRSIVVSWDNVQDGVLEYQIALSEGTLNTDGQLTVSAIIPSQRIFNNVVENSIYMLRVLAFDGTGIPNSPYTLRINTTFLPGPTSTSLDISANTRNDPYYDASVVWALVPEAQSYSVTLYRHEGDNLIQTMPSVNTTQTQRVFKRIPPGQYEVEVVAMGKNRFNSDASTQTNSFPRLRLPTPLSENIAATATIDSIVVQWQNPYPNVVQTYNISALGDTAESLQSATVTATAEGQYTITNLSAGVEYTLNIIARGQESVYLPSFEYTTKIRVGYLSDVTIPVLLVVDEENDRIVVSLGSARQGIVEYILTLTKDGSDSLSEWRIDAQIDTRTAIPLTGNGVYIASVIALNEAGARSAPHIRTIGVGFPVIAELIELPVEAGINTNQIRLTLNQARANDFFLEVFRGNSPSDVSKRIYSETRHFGLPIVLGGISADGQVSFPSFEPITEYTLALRVRPSEVPNEFSVRTITTGRGIYPPSSNGSTPPLHSLERG
ncbi:MAG: fibronectin type III domain-containing protein [Candidatus Oxydemutatoraceae bacterium WSBS_2016_MAG_OTU14]